MEWTCEGMKKYGTMRTIILLVAGILALSISPVSAADPIAIDPVPGNLTAGSVIEITGTTTLPAGTNLHYEFLREGTETGGVRYGEYSGTEGIIPAGTGAGSQVWKVPILTAGCSPGEYTFRIGKEGSDDRVSAKVQLVPGTIIPTPGATQSPARTMFESPMYVSPGGSFSVKTVPDLNSRSSILAKGAPLIVTTATSPGNQIGIWITSASSMTRYTNFQMITTDGNGNAEYMLPNTSAMRSGQYFLYIVDGGKSLEVTADKNDPSKFLSADDLETELNTHEQRNPYQKFMILLEEPTIHMNDIPDATSGTPVDIGGTTNLNAGTVLTLEMYPPDIDRLDQPASTISGIPVSEGTEGRGSWHAALDTSRLPPGEYIVKVRNGSTEATKLMVLYDSLYSANVSPSGTLLVKTYAVDPETKTVITGTTAPRAGFPVNPGMLAMICPAGLIGFGAILRNVRKK
ncbi:MAG: hypothetical protein ABFC24_08425 [Methanoregulaceae archaeon]